MGVRLLTAPIAGVGAEAKYFLIAFICRLADTEGMDMSVKALARSLAVTPGAASRARKALIEHQCLECHKAPTGGRPTRAEGGPGAVQQTRRPQYFGIPSWPRSASPFQW